MKICLVISNHDLKCRNIVSHILKCCTYEELYKGGFLDTLKALWEKKDTIDHVLTNLHKLGPKATNVLDQLKAKNFKISCMALGDRVPEWNGEELDISTYVLDIESMEEMKNLFEGANKEENSTNDQMVVSESRDITEPSLEDKDDEQSEEEASGDDNSSNPVERKPRLAWTQEMHKKFLEAIEILGPDNSFPKKIVELMNEPGVTRGHVASHLQKYRIYLRKNQKDAANCNIGTNLFFPLSHLSLQRYSHRRPVINEEPYSFGFHPRSFSSAPYLGMPSPLAIGSSTGLKPNNLEPQQQSGLMQMQPYVSRQTMSSNNSITTITTLNSQNLNSFIGLRFTGAGNLESGQSSSSKNEIDQTSMTLSSVGTTSRTKILDQSYPTSHAPKTRNDHEVKDDQYLPSIFSDWTSDEDQEMLALLTAPFEAQNVTLDEIVHDRAPVFVGSNAQEHSFPSGASGNGICVQESSMNEATATATAAAESSFMPDKFWKEVYDNADISNFH